MERPPVITHEDKWHAYIAEILEQIRDSVKPVEFGPIGPTLTVEGTDANKEALKEAVRQAAAAVEQAVTTEINKKPKKLFGKRGGKRDKDV